MEEFKKMGLRLESLNSSELQVKGGTDSAIDFWQLVDTGKKVLYFIDEYVTFIIEGFKKGLDKLHPTYQ
jgi:hypothetical protein